MYINIQYTYIYDQYVCMHAYKYANVLCTYSDYLDPDEKKMYLLLLLLPLSMHERGIYLSDFPSQSNLALFTKYLSKYL